MLNRENVQKILLSKSNSENKLICIEELAELQKEITKLERGRKTVDGLIEEMADVYIILEMLKQLYSVSDEALMADINRKMTRNLNRIKK